MKTKISIALGMLLIAASGCVNQQTARATLASAYDAIQKDNLADFQATLAPELSQKYGNEESLQKFRTEFAAYKEINFGDEILVRTERGSFGNVVLRVLSEQIIGKTADSKTQLLYTATVSCAVHTTMDPSNGEDYPGHVVETQHCEITDLK
jgi:hypothetical protein